jgi:hypothetical protein
MIQASCHFVKINIRMVLALLALPVASCTMPSSSPEQIQSSNPSVTYKYQNDQELLQANQSATAYCSQYRGVPQAISFTPDPDGSNDVVYQCVPSTAQAGPQIQANQNLTYSYSSDAQLLDASRSAQTYCMNNDSSSQVSANITTNADGTKTVTFQCNPPENAQYPQNTQSQ